MVNSYYECRFKELFLYSLQALVKQSTEAAYFPGFFVTSSVTKIQYINITQLNRVFRDYEDTMSNVSVYSIFVELWNLFHTVVPVFVNNTGVTVHLTAPLEFTVTRAQNLDCRFLHSIPALATHISATSSLRTRHFPRLMASRTLSVHCSRNS